MATFIIARLTFKEAVRRRILLAAFLLGLAFLLLYGTGFSLMSDQIGRQFQGPTRQLYQSGFFNFLSLAGMYAVNFLAIAMGALLSADTLAGEIGSGTIQAVVTKPVRRPVYLLSRVAGVFAIVCAAAAVGLCAEGLGRLAAGAAAVPWLRLADAFGGTLVVSLLTIALLTLLGSITRAYFNAAIYVITEAAFSIAESILGVIRVKGHALGAYLESHPPIERGVAAADDFFFASAPETLQWLWVLRVLASVAIALLLACLAFARREVPYGSD